MNWYKTSQIQDFEIPKIPYQGVCYHGSTYRPEVGVFDNLSADYSEWNAIWVCPEENIAETFASDWHGDDGTPVVFKVNVNLKSAANMRPFDKENWDALMDVFGYNDIRQLIPHLMDNGCDGWLSVGSIGQELYFDIAIFSRNVNVQEAKVKINGVWTPYMSLNDLSEKLKSEEKEDELV